MMVEPPCFTALYYAVLCCDAMACSAPCQVVKELRTHYAAGVADCAKRLANVMRACPDTNIQVALQKQKPSNAQRAYQQVRSVRRQRRLGHGCPAVPWCGWLEGQKCT